MAINIAAPQEPGIKYGLYQCITEILRRALDVSINPAQMNVQLNITGNDLKIVTAGNGVQIAGVNAAGSSTGNYWRVGVVEATGEDGSTYGVLTVTKV